MEEIASAVKDAAKRYVIDSASWMDARTKIIAAEKISNVVDFVGYPDLVFANVSQLDSVYSDVSHNRQPPRHYLLTVQEPLP